MTDGECQQHTNQRIPSSEHLRIPIRSDSVDRVVRERAEKVGRVPGRFSGRPGVPDRIFGKLDVGVLEKTSSVFGASRGLISNEPQSIEHGLA